MTAPKRSLRTRVKRAIQWCGGLAVLAVVLALVVVHNLEHPWVKRRVQALARGKAGLDIDYRAVRVSVFSGIAIDDLVVRSPPDVQKVAPDFAKVGHIDATWSLFGSGPAITSATLRDVAVTVTVDERGHTSLDTLFPPSTEPSPPLSKKAESLLGTGLPIGDVTIEHVSLALVKTEKGSEVQRTTLDGLSLEAHAEGTKVHALLGRESEPLHLAIDRRGQDAASAHASFWLTADVDATDAAIATSIHVDDQTFVEGASVAQAIHASARAHFDSKAARTDVNALAEIADGAAHAASADLTVPDVGAPIVRFAAGDVDVARVLAMAPHDLVPIGVTSAKLRYRVAGLVLDSPPHLDPAGMVAIDGDVSGLTQRLASGALTVKTATFDVHASAGMAVKANAKIDGVKLAGASIVDGDGVTLAIDGTIAPDRAMSGTVKVGFTSLAVPKAAMRDGSVLVTLGRLVVDPENPLGAHGDVKVACDMASLNVPGVAADTVVMHAHSVLTGHAPFGLDLDGTTHVHMEGGGRTLADGAANITAKISNATPDMGRPIASTGTVHATLAFGEATTELDATKEADAADYKLHAALPTLALARPFVPSEVGAQIPLERIGMKLESEGRVQRIASSLPEIKHHTKVELDQPAFMTVAAKAITLVLDSKGNALQHDADIDVRTQALAIAGVGTADDHITVKAVVDRAAPSARLNVLTEGRGALDLAVTTSFDRARHALAYDVDTKISKLGPLAPLIATLSGVEGINLAAFGVELVAKGDLLGVVDDVGANGAVTLAPTPTATLAAIGTVDLHVTGFAFDHKAVVVTVPKLAWHADLGLSGARRTLDSKLDVGEAHLAAGAHVLDVTGISDHIVGSVLGDLRNPDADATQTLHLRTLKQDFAPLYPVGDVVLDWAAKRDHRGIVQLSSLKLSNGAGGSEVTVAGSLDLSGAQRRLALHGNLAQDLAKLSHDATVLTGSGAAALSYRFESGDLVVYRTRFDAKLTNATVRLPARGIVVEDANGVVPINLEIAARPSGVELLRNAQVSPYSMLRFSDQHPLLTRNNFLSIHSITTPWVQIAPLAANLQIDRNVIALGQLEMGIRKGRVTGSCAVDWNGLESTVDLHVRATNVMSTHDEPFDGNAAVMISARERSIEGRADVLKIGKRHFLDLLDLVDPTRTDAAMNRVRSGLSLGYPERVHLGFDHGFASAHIELGGLGSILSIDDLHGIPIGPIVERALRNSKGSQ